MFIEFLKKLKKKKELLLEIINAHLDVFFTKFFHFEDIIKIILKFLLMLTVDSVEMRKLLMSYWKNLKKIIKCFRTFLKCLFFRDVMYTFFEKLD